MINDFVTRVCKINELTIVKGYDIQYELTITTRGHKFLYYDFDIEDSDRIVVFTQQIKIYTFCKLQSDGTFKSVQRLFEQLFNLQCSVRNKKLPLVYFFMKTKSEVAYNKFVGWLYDITINDKIIDKSIILDFETTSMNALKKFFTGSQFFGCNFHLGHIIVWRRIQLMKFLTEFINNSTVYSKVKMILVLSFISIYDVLLMAARFKSYLNLEKSLNALKVFE